MGGPVANTIILIPQVSLGIKGKGAMIAGTLSVGIGTMDPGWAGTAPCVGQRVRNCWPALKRFLPKGGWGEHLQMWGLIPASPWAAPRQPFGDQPGALQTFTHCTLQPTATPRGEALSPEGC